MKELYQLIVSELKKAPEIKWIDFDYGQLENEKLGSKFPCGLIKLNSNNKDIDESGSQQKNPTVQLRLAWDALGSRTSADTPESVLSRSLAWSDTAKQVYDLFQGTELGDYNAFECTSEGMESRSDGKVVYQFTFNSQVMVFK
jgi:hypothetical protein